MTDQKSIPENGNDKQVLSFQVSQDIKDYFEQFGNKHGYQTLSNSVKVHLRVAMHINKENPDEFFKLIADSSYIALTP